MGKTLYQSGYAPGGGITSATTQYWQPGCPPTTQTTTEAICQIKIRSPGTFSNLQIRLGGNTVTANSTFRSRKNGANGGQSVTITANTTGLFEDTTGSDAVVDGDLYCVQMVPGSGTMGITYFSQVFEATTNTVTKLSCNHVALSADSGNYYFPPGVDGINQTEAQAKLRIRKAGTFKKLAVYVQTARTTNTILRSRKNGANGNLSLTMIASTTGFFEDTTNSDTVAVGDDYCLNVSNSTTTGSPTYRGITVDFETTTNDGLIINGACAGVAFTEPTDAFLTLSGRLVANTTETNRAIKVNAAFNLSNVSVYVTANTNTTNCVAELRVNGFNTALSASITASSTGLFVDSTNTLALAPSEEVLFHLGFPSVAGTQTTTISWVAVWIQEVVGLTRVSKSQIYKYNLTGRVEQARIYRYSILGLVSAARIYLYSIQSRMSAARIYRYSIQARASLARIYNYGILTRVASPQIYLYSISNLVQSAKIYRYSISSLVSASKIYRYSIVARVQQSRIYRYDILGRISNIEIYRYSISSLVSAAKIYRYSIVGRVQQARVYRYSIQNLVQLARVYRYSILSKVSLARVYRYSIQSRVSLLRTYIYNLGESGELRVSKTQQYLYSIIGRVQQPQVYRYSALQRVGVNALSLDGVNDYIALGTDAGLWNDALSSFTFTLWIRPSIVGGDGNFRDLVNHGWGQNHGFTSYFNSSTKAFVVEIASTWPARIATASYSFVNLPPNSWYHIAVVYDSADPTRVKLYVDCTLATSITNNPGEVLTNATQLLISSSASDYKGLVRDFRWFTNQALDMEDIQKVCADAPDAPPANYWLKMNEQTGNPIDTISGTKVGTLQNGPKWIQSLNAIKLDGIDDYIDLGTQTTFYWSAALTRFSFSFWFKSDGYDAVNNRYLINHGAFGAQTFYVYLDGPASANRIVFTIRNAANAPLSTTLVNANIHDGNWRHCVCVYDSMLASNNIRMYIDKIASSTGANLTETITKNNTTLGIGQTPGGAQQSAFAGLVKDFRWWTSKALSQQEIDSTYANAPDAPIPDYWLKINEGTGNPADDITSTKTGALTNGASWASSAPDVWLGNAQRAIYGILNRVSKTIVASSPYSIFFDGIDDQITIPNIGAINNLDDFTISLWIYPITPYGLSTPHVFNKLYPTNNGFILYFSTGSFTLNFRTVNNTGVGVSATTGIITNPNQWYHLMISFVRSTGAMKLYVDGILRGSATNTGLLANSVGTVANLTINGAGGVVKWGGYVKDFRLWRSNQDTAIANIYSNATVAPYSIVFDGINDGLNLGLPNTLKNLTQGFTWTFWVYPTLAGTPFRNIVHHDYPNPGGYNIWYGGNLPSNQYVEFKYNIAGTNYFQGFADGGPPNNWYFVAIRWDNVTKTSYVRWGSLTSQSGARPSTQTMGLAGVCVLAGKAGGTSSSDFGGNMTDVRFFRRPLSDQEITDIMNGKWINEPDLYIPFTEGAGTPVDKKSNVVITSIDAPTWDKSGALPVTVANPMPDYWLKMDEGSGNPKNTIQANDALLQNGATWIESAPDVFLGKIQKYIYNILQRASLVRNYLYNINSRVSQLNIYRYSILSQLSLSKIYRYSIQQIVSSQKTFRYSILSRASLSRIYRYGILTRLVSPKIFRYSILSRRSLSAIYRYSIESRVSLLRSYRYSILSQISRSRIFRYSILTRVSKEMIYRYHIIPLPSPVKWQLTGKKTDFTAKLEDLVKNFVVTNWSITDPSIGISPRIVTDTIPQRQAQADNFAYDNMRSYYMKIREMASRIQTRKIRYNTYEFETPIEFECYSRRLKKGEAFNELNNMINELMRIFGTYQLDGLFGIQGVTFFRITQMDREKDGNRTVWSRKLTIILHYYKVSVLG